MNRGCRRWPPGSSPGPHTSPEVSLSPTAFGWWATGLAAAGVATMVVARRLKVSPDGFLRREVPLAVLAIPVLLIGYVYRSFQWSNTLLNSRAFGSPDSTLRTV